MNRLFISLLFFVSFTLHGQKTPFTVQDAIKVKSLSSQSLTEDGRYLAGIIYDGTARFETDHFRYRDPSYLNVQPGEFMVMEVSTGKTLWPLGEKKSRVSGLSWDKKGEKLAFLQQEGEELILKIYEPGRGRLRGVTLAGSTLLVNTSPVWLPDGEHVLLQVRDTDWLATSMAMYREATIGPVTVYDGSEPFLKWDAIGNRNALAKVMKVHINSGKMEELLPEGNYQGLYPSADGQWLIFNQIWPMKTSYERGKGTDYQVAYMPLQKADTTRILYPRNESRRNYNWSESRQKYAWTQNGNIMVGALEDTTVYHLTKDKVFDDEEKKKAVRFSIVEWSPLEDQLLLSSEKGWWLAAVDGSRLEMVYELPEDKENAPNLSVIHWSPDARTLTLSVSEKKEWSRGFARYDLQTRQMQEMVKDSRLYTGVQLSKDGSLAVLNLSDGDMPSDLVRTTDFINFSPLTDLNPWMATKKLTRSELISYRNVDGKELQGILYYPVDYEEGKKYPLVIEVYETFFNNGYNRNMNLFANQGYFALRPSVELEIGYPGEAWVKGITSAINKLVDEGKVDNDKVGVQGGSYGGYATSLLITQTDRFAAAINISGKVNIISFLGDSPKIGTRNYNAAEEGQDRIGGSLWDEPLKYLATTAVLYADRIKTPHMIMTGEGDWNVPATNSRELYYAMRRLGKDVVWVNYMRGGHGAGNASNEADYYDHWERVFAFYEKHFNKEKEKE
jgi:dipeptidyl aminopeptidase/acylaminoacyl peptidase